MALPLGRHDRGTPQLSLQSAPAVSPQPGSGMGCLVGIQAGCAPPMDLGAHAEQGKDFNMVPRPMGAPLDRLGGRSPSG